MSDKKEALPIYRTSAIYSGRMAGKVETFFFKATTKDDAYNAMKKAVVDGFKVLHMKSVPFDIKVSLSSQDELDFYAKNLKNKSYTGLVN